MTSVIQYLRHQQLFRPDHAPWFATFENLFTKESWHQLTTRIFEYIDQAPGNKDLLNLYQNFVAHFEAKMNPLLLVEFVSHVVSQMSDPNACIALIENLKPKVDHNKMASVLCSIMIGEQSHLKNDFETVERLLDYLSNEMDDHVNDVTPIHARYCLFASDYYNRSNSKSNDEFSEESTDDEFEKSENIEDGIIGLRIRTPGRKST